MRKIFYGRYGMMRLGWVFAIVIAIIAAIVAVCIAILVPVTASYDHRQCNRYEQQTGRDTKFVKFSFWTWDCYVKLNDGRYVPKSQFYGNQQDQ